MGSSVGGDSCCLLCWYVVMHAKFASVSSLPCCSLCVYLRARHVAPEECSLPFSFLQSCTLAHCTYHEQTHTYRQLSVCVLQLPGHCPAKPSLTAVTLSCMLSSPRHPSPAVLSTAPETLLYLQLLSKCFVFFKILLWSVLMIATLESICDQDLADDCQPVCTVCYCSCYMPLHVCCFTNHAHASPPLLHVPCSMPHPRNAVAS